jgi:hypothetical protein
MRTIEISEATAPLAEYAKELGEEPIILTKNGNPTAALVEIENADLETVSLSNNPKFIALIERSRAQIEAEGGIPIEEVRRQLGL